MAEYRYRARSSRGDAVEGTMESTSAEAVATQLMASGLTPVDIDATPNGDARQGGLRRLLAPRVGVDDLVQFSRQMHSLLKAGVPLLSALSGLARTTRNPALAATLGEVAEHLESGRDLANSLSQYPEVFQPFYVSMVRVGETTGRLSDVFLRLAVYLDREKQTRDRVRSALRYPLFVVVAIAAAVAIINVVVVPAFTGIYERFDADLPLPTQVVVAMSEFTVAYWPALLAGLVALVFAIRLYLQTEEGRYRWHRWQLRLPVVGPIIHRALLARFARLFAMSSRSGVPLVTTISTVGRALGNDYLQERVLGMREGVERGQSIAHTAAGAGMFDPLVLQMIAVGEESGNVDELLEEVSEHYDREVDYDIERLSASLGPTLVVIVGGLVLILALAVFLPMWDLATAAFR